MDVDHMIELEEQLAVRTRTDLGGTKPLEDFPELRRTRQHVELERKDVGAVHPAPVIAGFWAGLICSVTTSGFLSPRVVITTSYFQSRTYYKPCLLFLFLIAMQRRCL